MIPTMEMVKHSGDCFLFDNFFSSDGSEFITFGSATFKNGMP